jgi:hypothetical protein
MALREALRAKVVVVLLPAPAATMPGLAIGLASFRPLIRVMGHPSSFSVFAFRALRSAATRLGAGFHKALIFGDPEAGRRTSCPLDGLTSTN